MFNVVSGYLLHQDPLKPHSWLTRILVSGIVVFAQLVLHGVGGVLGAIVVYLLLVELAGLGIGWALAPLAVAVCTGLWSSAQLLADYWRNYGRGQPPSTGSAI